MSPQKDNHQKQLLKILDDFDDEDKEDLAEEISKIELTDEMVKGLNPIQKFRLKILKKLNGAQETMLASLFQVIFEDRHDD